MRWESETSSSKEAQSLVAMMTLPQSLTRLAWLKKIAQPRMEMTLWTLIAMCREAMLERKEGRWARSWSHNSKRPDNLSKIRSKQSLDQRRKYKTWNRTSLSWLKVLKKSSRLSSSSSPPQMQPRKKGLKMMQWAPLRRVSTRSSTPLSPRSSSCSTRTQTA